MDARASWSLSLLISGSFYLESFILDVKVEILGWGGQGVPGKKGRSLCPGQGHRGPGPSPWISWAKAGVQHQHKEEIRAGSPGHRGCCLPSWAEGPTGKFLVDRLRQLFKSPVICVTRQKSRPFTKPSNVLVAGLVLCATGLSPPCSLLYNLHWLPSAQDQCTLPEHTLSPRPSLQACPPTFFRPFAWFVPSAQNSLLISASFWAQLH